MLAVTEADLETIAAACARARAPLRGTDKIALRVGTVIKRRKVARHFTIEIGEERFSYARNLDSVTPNPPWSRVVSSQPEHHKTPGKPLTAWISGGTGSA